ncbi:hypothetical protein LWI29_025703 [Acer saccharum]|uniref:Protein kinase domain-containing protein n=1 Tax=Acer saccharum TaxID=4024 RepID=A0AA39RVA6_ACESA|nr:hypothetical protein LWI29_025703 [Acer saccharum]
MFFVLVALAYVFLRKWKAKRDIRSKQGRNYVDEIESESLQFDFSTIKAATNDFPDNNKLGQGGFGAVYKGRLSNGQDVAVKRLSTNSGQGDVEFKNEVLLVAKLQHRNLVRLLGFCLERKERLLIYEFVPNSSLDNFIFDPIKRGLLDWETRYKIIGGIARGILYLHEDSRLRIVHRDLKASNILLGVDMNPKISDFGMARLFKMDETQGDTSRVVGTFGYMAPEYLKHGQFSVKSDVFSFGVLVLEIISGRKNSCFDYEEKTVDLLTYAWMNWKEGTALNVMDPTMRVVGSTSEIMRCIHIGLLCVQENVASIPTMALVVVMLTSSSVSLPTWKLWCEEQAVQLMDPTLTQSCIPTELLKYIHIGLLCVQGDPTDRPPMSSLVFMLTNDNIKLPKPTQPAFFVGRVVVRSDQSSSDVKTWKLWCDEQAAELMDPALTQSCDPTELLKYIHIGLLCVQGDPANRPPMSSVVFMLANDNIKLPKPTQPAFFVGRVVVRSDQSSSDVKVCTVNEVTLSDVSPR